ncbi:(d)CMP kinase [Lentiprolixibacter aurantiacus]|uniref:Cytidylate kinase n=1 Tax=Lentiprolixibacter aurantiacus TaxID=2993939 RepID=A0AAE3MN68_9FLAO|nr:(d)CMP kinase [Lentiprolixibacter aurantiacus]MCX2719964.1 (d)CMP kinase [Lentiprolixibacter aurantiacus]
MPDITIAIDGFSSTGKSTVARQLASALSYVYVDTGAMYRAVTLYAIRSGFTSGENVDHKALVDHLNSLDLEFRHNSDTGRSDMYLNGENVEKEIRTLEVSSLVSQVSVLPEVRTKLVALQRKMGENKALVMDGRDIGTVVFPDAELKIFMTASPDIRAARRYKELLDRGEDVKYEDVLENVRKRDHIDANRAVSPLKKADDAVVVDNSDMGREEQFERLLFLAKQIIGQK